MIKNNPFEPLRLIAQDEADLELISTLLQDAIIAGSDMHFDIQNSSFLLVVNRFCWERPAIHGVNNQSGGEVHERVLCGFHMSFVTDVQKRNWPPDWRHAFFSLLSLNLVRGAKQNSNKLLEFCFSGNPLLRVSFEKMYIVLSDLGNVTPTNLQPRHDL